MALFRKERPPEPATTTAVLLAGGASTRFGAPKGLAELQGRPMIRWVATAAGAAAGYTVLSLGHGVDEAPWRATLEAPSDTKRFHVVHDAAPGLGPVAGLQAARDVIKTPYVMVVAADMPLLGPDLYVGLLERLVGHDAVAFHLDGWWRPMPALWRVASLDEALKAADERGLHSLHALFDAIDARPLGREFLHLFDPEERTLVSINTRDELGTAETWLRIRQG